MHCVDLVYVCGVYVCACVCAHVCVCAIHSSIHHSYSMSCLQAMEWLIQHQNDSDIDDPISSSSTTKPSDTNNVSLQGETLLPLPAAIPQEGIASDSSTSSRKDKSKSDKPKKGVKRRKWEFVPDKAVSRSPVSCTLQFFFSPNP